MLCPKCGANIPDGALSCPACGTATADEKTDYPMKWYRFMVCFGVWASALICLGLGIEMFTGLIYDGDVDVAYDLFGSLRALDKTAGPLFALNAVLFVIAAIRMLKRKKGAPAFLAVCYAFCIVLSLAYVCVSYSVLYKHIDFFGIFFSTTAYAFLSSAVMLCVNGVYFKKRAALFTN